MAESVELPSRLGILPFKNKVLLPGAIIRIRCTSPSSVKLVEQELWQREEKGLIGILPVRDAAERATVSPVLSQGVGSDSGDRSSRVQVGTSDSQRLDGKVQHEVIHWHTRGVAARALHLSRGVEKPSGRVTYVVILEGLCRFNVQELSTRGTYNTARISPLEMSKFEMEQVEQDPEFITLSRQFKATATELISVLEQKQKTGGRTKVLLETVPIHKLADIFVASFEISFEEQLCMLDSVDLKVRLSKATELVDRHLQSVHVAEKITQKVEGQLSKSQKEFLLRQQMRAIKEELGDNDDDDDDVVALERSKDAQVTRDRSKDVIISGGENISSVEVESVLYGNPAVNEAAVVARPDEFWGETPCAFVSLKSEVTVKPTEEEIIEYCKAKMPRYMVPRTVVFMEELPKTSTGKIQKFVLRETAKGLGTSRMSRM